MPYIDWKAYTSDEDFNQLWHVEVDCQRITVSISKEALEDKGEDACRECAKNKIEKAMAENGTPPKLVEIRNSDF